MFSHQMDTLRRVKYNLVNKSHLTLHPVTLVTTVTLVNFCQHHEYEQPIVLKEDVFPRYAVA